MRSVSRKRDRRPYGNAPAGYAESNFPAVQGHGIAQSADRSGRKRRRQSSAGTAQNALWGAWITVPYVWERIYCKVRQTAILPGLCSGGGAGGRQRSIETMEQGEWVLRKATAFPKKRGENLRNMRKTCTSWNAVYHMFRGMRQAAPSSLGAKCPYPQRETQNRTDNISVGQASKGKGERVTLAVGFMLGALGQMR